MKSLSESPTRTFVFFLKSLNFVLEAFNVSLNQSAIFESSKFAICSFKGTVVSRALPSMYKRHWKLSVLFNDQSVPENM